MSKLDDRLAKARAAIRTVGKRGENTAQRYKYARAEDVIAEARKALADAGLILTSEVVGMTPTPITASSGAGGRLVDLQMRYHLTTTDANAPTRSFEWLGSGQDYPGDKATYKAITGGHKYFLLHLLEIPVGDDPEDERAAKPGKARGKPAKSRNGVKGPAPKPATVKAVGQAIEKVGLGFDRLRTLIGSVGGDAPSINRGDSIAKAVRALSEPQATQLLGLIESEAGE